MASDRSALRRSDYSAAEPPQDDLEALRPQPSTPATVRIERRKGERRGMEALRAEALQNIVARVEDRNFGGLRTRVQWPRALSRSRLILLAIALIAGGLAAYLATDHQPATEAVVAIAPPPAAAAPTTQILVAKTAIGMGERLGPASVEWIDWPDAQLRPEFITRSADAAAADPAVGMTGAVARFEFFPGEPIREAKLAHSSEGYLSAILDTGMRGVSVAVTADSASGGFIVPNDHVDVVLTRTTPGGEIVSQTVLSNARVLAINTRLGEAGATGAAADPSASHAETFAGEAIATLELDPTEAEIVINASRAGKLSLSLRAMTDTAEAAKIDQLNQAIRNNSPFWAPK